MNKIIGRGICALGVAIVGAFGMAGTGSASEGDAVWIIDGGCGFLSDGYVSYQAACLRTDGAWDFYIADAGEWIYGFSSSTDSDGCTTLFTEAGSLGSACVQNWADPLGYVGGGTLIQPLGYPVIDAMMTNVNNDIINHTQSPLCIEIDGDICYT